eukprot:2687449-Pleurochrysis_carterae.AAC.1
MWKRRWPKVGAACTPSRASRSENWWDKNSPALSLWILLTTRVGVSRPALRRAAKPARDFRMYVGASHSIYTRLVIRRVTRENQVTREGGAYPNIPYSYNVYSQRYILNFTC